MNLKLINEGFEKRYGNPYLRESEDEENIFHNDNGKDYEILERSESETNILLKNPNGNQWIIAWNCPKNNKGSWGQGHYFFDEESAREVWEDRYKNESLNEDFNGSIVDEGTVLVKNEIPYTSVHEEFENDNEGLFSFAEDVVEYFSPICYLDNDDDTLLLKKGKYHYIKRNEPNIAFNFIAGGNEYPYIDWDNTLKDNFEFYSDSGYQDEINESLNEEYQTYEVTVGFCGYVGVEETYEVDAESKQEAVEEALDLAAEDLSVIDTEKIDDNKYKVTIGFLYMGAEETYSIITDSEKYAVSEALKQARLELDVISVNDEDYIDESLNKKKLKEDFEQTRVINTSLKSPKDIEILNSIIGQMSDGIWENSPSMNVYWKNIDITKDGNIEVNDDYYYRDYFKNRLLPNKLKSMRDNEIKNYLANKLRAIVKIHSDNENINFKENWNSTSEEVCDYLGYKEEITYGDAFNAYQNLRH